MTVIIEMYYNGEYLLTSNNYDWVNNQNHKSKRSCDLFTDEDCRWCKEHPNTSLFKEVEVSSFIENCVNVFKIPTHIKVQANRKNRDAQYKMELDGLKFVRSNSSGNWTTMIYKITKDLQNMDAKRYLDKILCSNALEVEYIY